MGNHYFSISILCHSSNIEFSFFFFYLFIHLFNFSLVTGNLYHQVRHGPVMPRLITRLESLIHACQFQRLSVRALHKSEKFNALNFISFFLFYFILFRFLQKAY